MTCARRLPALGLLAPLACSSLSAQPDVPAIIAPPTAEAHAELTRIVTSAFNGVPVALADDALTRDSVLVIEQREPRDAQGRRIGGRSLDMPWRFRLVLRGSRCLLVRESDRMTWPMTVARCIPSADR